MKKWLGFGWGLFLLATVVYGNEVNNSVSIEYVVLHSQAVENNLEGNSPDRELTVFLPPSYGKEPLRRYPVLYALHGYSVNNRLWADEINALTSIENAFKNGAAEMIVVLPNSQTVHNGSMYTSSVTTGDWERFITDEVVNYVDNHYRTLAHRDSRGLVGHSMGGYGTLRLGMKHPELFAALYAMSPCCLLPNSVPPADLIKKLTSITSIEQSSTLNFFDRMLLATAVAWSPNPNKPPFYADFPAGEVRDIDSVMARWIANSPVAMTPQYLFSLKEYRAIAIDCGDQDGLKEGAKVMYQQLVDLGVEQASFELYSGDHVNGIAQQFEKRVLPFFTSYLAHTPQ